MALSYYCPMLVKGFSASINFLQIAPLIPLLNSSISSLLSYPLSLATLLNSYINSYITLSPCSNFFNSATFTDSSSPPPNSFLMTVKNFPTDSNSSILSSKYLPILSKQMTTPTVLVLPLLPLSFLL